MHDLLAFSELFFLVISFSLFPVRNLPLSSFCSLHLLLQSIIILVISSVLFAYACVSCVGLCECSFAHKVCVGVLLCVQVCVGIFTHICKGVVLCVQVCVGLFMCTHICKGVALCVQIYKGTGMCTKFCVGIVLCAQNLHMCTCMQIGQKSTSNGVSLFLFIYLFACACAHIGPEVFLRCSAP